MKKFILNTLVLSVLSMTAHNATARTDIITAQQINGTWERLAKQQDTAHIDIRALGQQKLAVSIKAFGGVNVGESTGEAYIVGRRAVFADVDNQCKIEFRFIGARMQVKHLTPVSECGWGLNVWAEGVYKKNRR